MRSALGLRAAAPVELRADGEHSNINHVYRVRYGAGRSLYLKVVPARPRRLPVALPRERFLSEAEAIRRFGRLAGGAVVVPELLFVDRGSFALAMSDVGGGRRVLLDLLPGRYALLAEQAEPLGRALAAVHAGSRGMKPLRPAAEAAAIEAVIFDGLLAPGARAVFPERWEEIRGELRSDRRVLVHADLWGKNLLVAPGRRMAVVDFEGAMLGDPAFDLGTLLAVALVPAFERPAVLAQAAGFVHRLLATYVAVAGAGAADEAQATCRRACRAAAVFLAARGFGPFAYPLPDRARERLAELAARLARRPPQSTEALVKQAILHAGGLTGSTAGGAG